MNNISLKFNDNDYLLIKKYAKKNNVSISTYIKNIVIEAIEDEYDYNIAVKAHQEYLSSNRESTSLEEFIKKYNT